MTNSNKEADALMGCFMYLWSLFVCSPMWLVLMFMFMLMQAREMPPWCWVLYWCYVPAHLLGIILNGIVVQVFKARS